MNLIINIFNTCSDKCTGVELERKIKTGFTSALLFSKRNRLWQKKEFTLLSEYLYWSYANLAMAHAAVEKKADKYTQISYIIRSRLFKGLMQKTMNIGSIIDDERLKIRLPQVYPKPSELKLWITVI